MPENADQMNEPKRLETCCRILRESTFGGGGAAYELVSFAIWVW